MNKSADISKKLPVMVPLLMFVLTVVICCAVVTGVLVKSLEFSEQARQCGDAVQLCRNAAEQYRVGTAFPEGKLFFDDKYAENPQGEYYLTVKETKTQTAVGCLYEALIQAYTSADEPLYSLTVQRYDKEVQP